LDSSQIASAVGALVLPLAILVAVTLLKRRASQQRNVDLAAAVKATSATLPEKEAAGEKRDLSSVEDAEDAREKLIDDLRRLIPRATSRWEEVSRVNRGKRNGMVFEVMDYTYTVKHGPKSFETREQTVVRCRMGFQVPEFCLRYETLLDKAGHWLGWRDIDFESHPEFSRRYFLRAADEIKTRAFFKETVLARLQSEPGTWCLGGFDEWMVIFRPGGFVARYEMDSYIKKSLAILSLFRDR
jgi:hypothetical protein